jgi:general secretion pathway protein D
MFPTVPGQPPPPPQIPASGASSVGASAALFDGDVHITADVPTNALVITAAAADYKSLLPVIRKLDIRRKQAFVEAMIVEVDIDKALDLGVSSHLGGQFNGGDTTVFGSSQLGSVSSLAFPTDPASIGGFVAGLQGPSLEIPIAGGETLTLPAYGARFKALQTNGTINVLSTPNILTSDNKEAEIVVGQVVPFITAQGRDINNQPINQIQRENVAITLRVTPQINESDDITLEIYQEIQDLVPGPDINTFGPTTSTRNAKTSVLVKDGQTVTIGGLISDKEQNSISKVPVLGDIPLIGWFFKSKVKKKTKTSLAILLTPHIIRTPEDLQAMTIRKNQERQAFLRENNVDDHRAIKKYNLDRNLAAPISKAAAPEPEATPTPPPLPTPAPTAAPEEASAAPAVPATPAEAPIAIPPVETAPAAPPPPAAEEPPSIPVELESPSRGAPAD